MKSALRKKCHLENSVVRAKYFEYSLRLVQMFPAILGVIPCTSLMALLK